MIDFIESKSIQDYCRVCFKSPSKLFSCLTKLIIENVSISIIEVLDLISPKIKNNKHLQLSPNRICSDCKEIVVSVFHLKIKYEKTSQLLDRLFIDYEKEKDIIKTILQRDKKGEYGSELSYCEEKTLLPVYQTGTSDSVTENVSNEVEEEKILLVVEPQKSNAENTNKEEHLELELSANELEIEKNKENQNQYDENQKCFKHICPLCRSALSDADELRKHAVTHKVLAKYLKGQRIPHKARFVSISRNTITIFRRPNKLFQCVFCSEQLPIETFRTHLINHHNQTEFSCDKCNRVFRKLNHLKNHIISHLKTLPYQCKVCSKGFMLKENYECHVLIHTKPDNLPFKCEKCDKSFTNKKHLYHHSFKHTDQGSYWIKYKIHRCRICLRTFDSAANLQEHSRQNHDVRHAVRKRKQNKCKIIINDNGLFVCKYCSKAYDDATSLKKHINIIHEPRKLCSQCGLKVVNLKQHMLSHQEKKTIECQICHKFLSSKLTLAKHLHIHKEERPFQCSFCGKAFKGRYTLQVHERIHLGDKKHICPTCGKGFLEKAYMLKHLKTVHNNTFLF